MITFFKSTDSGLITCDAFEPGVWVQMINPTEAEIVQICNATEIEAEFIRPALDEEERPRIETDNGHTMILVDIPIMVNDGTMNVFSTLPLAITYSKETIVTVCLKQTPILSDFIDKRVKSFLTYYKSRFILQILFKSATLYLHYLRSIEKISNQIEIELRKSMKNRDLAQLLKLEKSLVYFSTSLKSNESVFEKMLKLEAIKRFEEDEDLLDDVIIENKQAIEMTNIYSSILSSTMNSLASMISNNLNIVMKSLTIITIALSVPMAISGFFGMNVPNFWENNPTAFPAIILGSMILSALTSFLLLRRQRF